ncbi:hypothetical protein [Miltoncostaea oceani]|uniref:hypothetical protein n=1 Tax=Miltoncostaea oceani TaxID=2843216 RepID=UPI001C3E8209|nr:hypothetical protein [Miltoncostaea oceani]
MTRSCPALMRPTLALLAIVTAMLLWALPEGSAAPRVTVIGDSVQASFGFAPQATRRFASPGLSVRLEAAVCRKLSSPGCLGGRPESALALSGALASGLGDVVVMHIGYNDFAARYDIDSVLRAHRRAGVRVVVWVTLREAQSHYATTNALIRSAARRANARGGLPLVRIADWNSASAGRPWFTSDQIHLNSAGAMGLAGLLRESVLAALADVGTSVDGRPATTRADTYPLGRRVDRIAGDADVLWTSSAGRLGALEPANGQRLPRAGLLTPGEDLDSDGRRAWLRDPTGGLLTQPAERTSGTAGLRVDGVGADPLLAQAGPWLWSIARCGSGDPVCTANQALRGVRLADGLRSDHLPGVRVVSIAADSRALWLLVERGRGFRLERLDPETGALVRSTRLSGRSAFSLVQATRRGAWVLADNGQLLGVDRSGTPRKILSRVRTIAAAGDQLWALKANRRTILSLHPVSGAARGQATVPRRLSDQITFTRDYVWVLSASGRQVLRLRRT